MTIRQETVCALEQSSAEKVPKVALKGLSLSGAEIQRDV